MTVEINKCVKVYAKKKDKKIFKEKKKAGKQTNK